MGLTYGKTMDEACEIGTRLSASVICTSGKRVSPVPAQRIRAGARQSRRRAADL
ncbi:MAG: hypothetical protein ACLSHO_01355 [Dysosmobacter sp.]